MIKDKCYDYLTTPRELQASTSSKIWGLFAPGALSNDIDSNSDDQPSLAQMTQKAIEILSRDKNGFFFMVEGGKVDWAAHANDPVAVTSAILAFDRAVKVSLDFA